MPDPVSIASWDGAPQTVNLSGTSARIQLIPKSYYRIWSSVDAFFLLGDQNVVADTGSHPVTGKLSELLATGVASPCYLAAVVSTGTGILYVSKIDPLP